MNESLELLKPSYQFVGSMPVGASDRFSAADNRPSKLTDQTETSQYARRR